MFRRLACLFLLAWIALAQEPAPQPEKAPVTADDLLYDEVKNVLALDRDVRGAAIDVTVRNGNVILRGRVRDEKAREKAPKIVGKVKGVASVTSELKLFTEK